MEVERPRQGVLQPGGPAPKRLRDESKGLGGGGKHQQGKRREQQRGTGGEEQGRGRWSMPGFNVGLPW